VTTFAAPVLRRTSRAAEVVAAIVLCGTVAVFLGLPVFAIIERALTTSDFFDAVSSSESVDALRLSLVTTGISLALILCFGTPVAYVLSRASFPGRDVLDALIDLPIVLPPAVCGLGLLMAFGRRGILAFVLPRQDSTASTPTSKPSPSRSDLHVSRCSAASLFPSPCHRCSPAP
jgi:molybdate transport system permease protein